MHITDNSFTIHDQSNRCSRIKSYQQLTGDNSAELRDHIHMYSRASHRVVYLDLIDVEHVDLYGINEVIHAHFSLQLISKKLILEYRKNSSVDHWVQTTGLDRFIETSITI
ncbi:MAG: hypothetical protein KJP00_06920 [Bacteroidia bacterium]|nr:hypothetical protein [Bacteroidia bacterium]